jgi:hypothetical protein
MKEEIKSDLVTHMKEFGLHMLAKGLVNATFNEMLNPFSHAMSIVHIGHGTELLIKARIAEEHPLLIFSTIPKSTTSIDTKLGLLDLLEKGQSIMYSELPERLWATTGYRIPDLKFYNDFGKVRNQIVHLAIPNMDLSDLALQFGYGLIEPMVNEWWDETLLEYAISYDEEYLLEVFDHLERLNIKSKYTVDDQMNLRKK